jgi:hypothetical protein
MELKQKIQKSWINGIKKIRSLFNDIDYPESNDDIVVDKNNSHVTFSHFKYNRKITISRKRFDHINNAWNNNKRSKQSFELITFCLLMRYDYLYDLSTNQLSTHPLILSTLAQTYSKDNIACEFCASIINNYFDVYCSLFYDLERNYGSLGSYNFVVPVSGLITIGVFPAISIVKDILTRNWFKNDDDNKKLTIYIKLQGGWGKHSDLLRMKSNKKIVDFYTSKIDKKCANFNSDMLQMRSERYGEKDKIDEYIDSVLSNPNLVYNTLIESNDYRWVDYIKNQSYCNNAVAIYILSNSKINSPDIANLKYQKNEDFIFQQYRDKSQQKTAEFTIGWLSKKYKI